MRAGFKHFLLMISGAMSLLPLTVSAQGGLAWSTTLTLNSEILTNSAGSVFDPSFNSAINGSGTFVNRGLLWKGDYREAAALRGVPDTVTVSVALHNSGTVKVSSGRLTLGTIQSTGGSFTVERDALLYTGGLTCYGDNLLHINGDPSYGSLSAFLGGMRIGYENAGALTVSGTGLANFSGDLFIGSNGSLTVSGGVGLIRSAMGSIRVGMDGAGAVTVSDRAVVNAYNFYVLSAGCSLTVAGSGTVLVGNAYAQYAGTTLNYEISANTPGLDVYGGRADLYGGALNITKVFTAGGTATILTAASGISGDFDTVGSAADYLTVSGAVSTDRKNYLVAYQLRWFADADAHGNFTVADGQSFEVGAALTDTAGAGGWDGRSLRKQGGGTLILSGANTHGGVTTVSGGTLLVSAGGRLAATEKIRVESGVFRYDSDAGLTRDVEVTGGKFAYNAAENFSGALTFSGGTLGGENLRGMGALAFTGGRALAPGNSIGTVTADAAVFDGGGFELELGGAALNDSLVVDALTLGAGGMTVSVVDYGFADFDPAKNYSWEFIDYTMLTGSVTADLFHFDNSRFTALDPELLTVLDTGGALFLQYNAVPEPSAWLLLTVSLSLSAALAAGKKKQSCGHFLLIKKEK